MLTFALIGGLALGAVRAGAQSLQLEPEDGAFTTPEFFLSYHLAVRRALFPTGVPGTAFVAVVLPSFESEWALFLHSPGERRTQVELRVIKGQIWSATQQNRPLPGFEARIQDLQNDVASAVVAALERALRVTRYPPPSNGMGLDGTFYHFSSFARGRGDWSAKIWSPAENTQPGKLVALLDRLREYVERSAAPSDEAEVLRLARAVPESKEVGAK